MSGPGPGNPLSKTHGSANPPTVSTNVYTIAGIQCTVHGLSELPSNIQELAVLWLLHPRLQKAESMAPFAAHAISHWNTRLEDKGRMGKRKGLIAVSFDQRNHGARMVEKRANEDWRRANDRHAPDMFSIYQGTAQDTCLLLSHLPSYLPHALQCLPTTHHALGISLGGHSVWHLTVSEPRIKTFISIIGCPDFTRLMLQRAERSKRPSFQNGGAKGFLTSQDYPQGLREEVRRADPAGKLLPSYLQAPNDGSTKVLPGDYERLSAALDALLKGKTVFALSGGADKLVPYAEGKVFYDFLKSAIGGEDKEGWWKGNNCVFVDRVYDGVGHETTAEMADDAVRFLADVVLEERRGHHGPSRL